MPNKVGRVILTLQVDNPAGDSHIIQASVPIRDSIDIKKSFDDSMLQDTIMLLMEQLDSRMKNGS